jgi:MSHA pilin protein MshA
LPSHKHNGFTLIELIIVIVILGILAVTAAPKFIDISTDATIAKLQGMQGALRSGTKLIYAKALIQDKVSADDTITVGTATIALHSGYPTGHFNDSMRYIVNLDHVWSLSSSAVICDTDWCGRGNQTTLPSGITTPGLLGKIYPKGYSFDDQCGVYYINNQDGSAPVIGLETDQC